jgi:hypothetical protein
MVEWCDIGTNNKCRGTTMKKDFWYIVLSLTIHPIAIVVARSFEVPFSVLPCLYCVIAVILGVGTIKIMAINKISREHIDTFSVLHFSLLLFTGGYVLVIYFLRDLAKYSI